MHNPNKCLIFAQHENPFKKQNDMKKSSLALRALAFSCAAVQAQDITKGMRLGAEFGIGSQVELNLRGQRHLNRYLS